MEEVSELRIRIWREGDAYRVAVDDDLPTVFQIPEHFWREYLETGKKIRPEQIRAFGQALFRSTFSTLERSDLAARWLTSSPPRLMRVLSEDFLIHEIPWEILAHPGKGILTREAGVSVVRGVPGWRHPLTPAEPPFRILVILSLPLEVYQKEPIDPLREIDKLERALEPWASRALVEIDIWARASGMEIRGRLMEDGYHIVHFIGHGGPEGQLVLEHEGDFRRAATPGVKETGGLFAESHATAVILNACHTATSGFAPSLALALHQVGIPLVVAHQAPVGDDDAIELTKNLYRALLGSPEAEEEARTPGICQALDRSRTRLREWWKPVLLLARDAGRADLFTTPKGVVSPAARGVFRDLGTVHFARVYVYRYQAVREITEF
jgi:hypothetical protein